MSSPPMPPNIDPPESGDPPEIGAYQVLGRLGQGGMGTVHLGRAADGRLVAVKIVHEELARDEEFRVRFAREVENAQRVASFCTATVIGQGEVDGRPYMVTEFIDGDTLYQHVSRNGPLPQGTLHGVAVGVAAGLAAIHSAGLVHRDLKPANVILSVSGPRVIDFGIARALDVASGATPTGFIVGSPGWIAPEQLLNRQIGTFADIFAWACLIGYAGTGRHPYGRGNAVTMAARILHAEPRLDGIPEPLLGLIQRALSLDPGDRPTALELLLALVGGGSQNVERATEQLFTTGWQPPVPADATPPQPTPPPSDGPASEGPADGPAPGTPPGGTPGTGQSLADLVQNPIGTPPPPGMRTPPPPDLSTPPPPGTDGPGEDQPHAAPAWPEAAGPDDVSGVPRAGMDGGEEPAAVAVPPEAADPHAETDPRPAAAPESGPSDPHRDVTGQIDVRPQPDTDVPTRKRRRTPVLLTLVGVLVLALGGGGYVLFRQQTGAAAFTPVPLGRSRPTDVGRPMHLGPADTTVGRPRCGPEEFRGRQARGRFCLVPLIMFGNGDNGTARNIRLSPLRLPLLDSGGSQHTPVAVVDGLRPGDTELHDGARVAGNLLYDVPRGADPVCIWLFTTEPHAAKKVRAWL